MPSSWPLFEFFVQANQQIQSVKVGLEETSAAADRVTTKLAAATDKAGSAETAYDRLAKAAQAFGNTYGTEGFDPTHGPMDPKSGKPAGEKIGGFITAAYLKYLVDLFADQMKVKSDPNDPTKYLQAADAMKLMDVWWSRLGGYILTGGKTIEQVARERDATPRANRESVQAAPYTPSTSGIGVGDGSLHRGKKTAEESGLPSDADLMRAQEAMYQLDDAGAEIQAKIDKITVALNAENKSADAIKDSIDETNAAITAGEAKLEAMGEAAGVSDKSGAGGKIKTINDALKEAQARLQYLTDKGASADAVADAEKAVVDLKDKLDDAQKQLRIATFEFEHSDAYKLQQEEIAKQREILKAKEEQQAEEEKRLAGIQALIDAERKKLDDLDVRRQKQQDILDAKRKDDDAKSAAAARQELEDNLTKLHGESSKFVGSFSATGNQIVSAIKVAAKVIVDALPNKSLPSDTLLPQINTGHIPPAQSSIVLSSTGVL